MLQPILDRTFSEHSYGFRPERRVHDAVLAAQLYVQSGRRVVVDVDLEKFFDRVNHDILIDRLHKRIGDAGVVRLIRAYLAHAPAMSRSGRLRTRDAGGETAMVTSNGYSPSRTLIALAYPVSHDLNFSNRPVRTQCRVVWQGPGRTPPSSGVPAGHSW